MPETFLNKAQLTGLSADARRTEILRAKGLAALDARITELEGLGRKAYAQVTGQGPFSTLVDLTNGAVTWTADADRVYETSFFGSYYVTVGSDNVEFQITTDSNVRLQSIPASPGIANQSRFIFGVLQESGISGPQTRKLRAQRIVGSGSVYTNSGSDLPFFITVKDIGPA